MERRLSFEGMISHLFLKAKQPNDQIGKILCLRLLKTVKENEFTGLIRHLDGIMTGATISIKLLSFFMVFFTYKSLNLETKHLKILST